jgi:hypothetical protein
MLFAFSIHYKYDLTCWISWIILFFKRRMDYIGRYGQGLHEADGRGDAWRGFYPESW